LIDKFVSANRFANLFCGFSMSNKLFITSHVNTINICIAIGADKLIYQDLEDLIWCVQQGNKKIQTFDSSCFDGKYVTGDIDQQYLSEIEEARADSVKEKNNTNESSELICNDVE
jgi:amidophosphoribosyltransferase